MEAKRSQLETSTPPPCKFVVLQVTAHLAYRKQPALMNAEIDEFLPEMKLPVPRQLARDLFNRLAKIGSPSR